MLLTKFTQDLVLLMQLGLQGCDEFLCGFLQFVGRGKGSRTTFEESLLPSIEQRVLDARLLHTSEMVACSYQMLAKYGHFIGP